MVGKPLVVSECAEFPNALCCWLSRTFVTHFYCLILIKKLHIFFLFESLTLNTINILLLVYSNANIIISLQILRIILYLNKLGLMRKLYPKAKKKKLMHGTEKNYN